MPTDNERREAARRLRNVEKHVIPGARISDNPTMTVWFIAVAAFYDLPYVRGLFSSLADLIEPSYKPDAKYEAWYNSLSHYGDKRGGPSTIRELIEEIVWTALTVDLGPNGNTDPSTGIDEGDVYTNNLFAEWEREALRLSGGCDRDALLALADNLESSASMLLKQNDLDPNRKRRGMRRDHAKSLMAASDRIRAALGEVE